MSPIGVLRDNCDCMSRVTAHPTDESDAPFHITYPRRRGMPRGSAGAPARFANRVSRQLENPLPSGCAGSPSRALRYPVVTPVSTAVAAPAGDLLHHLPIATRHTRRTPLPRLPSRLRHIPFTPWPASSGHQWPAYFTFPPTPGARLFCPRFHVAGGWTAAALGTPQPPVSSTPALPFSSVLGNSKTSFAPAFLHGGCLCVKTVCLYLKNWSAHMMGWRG